MITKRKIINPQAQVTTFIGAQLITKILRENQGNNEIVLDFSSDKYEL